MTPQQIVAKLFGSAWRFVRGYSGGTAVNSDGHHGWDLSAAIGTPIPALVGGKVVYAEFAGGGGPGFVNAYRAPDDARKSSTMWTTGGGNTVVIEASDGTRYQYAHLQAFGVKVGDTISPGQFVGKMGATGDATGSHLHFAMIKTEKYNIPRGGVGTRNLQWLNPSALMTSLASSGVGFNLLGAFDNAIAFEYGHTLTEADVNKIIERLDAVGFFKATDLIPGLQQLAENQARDTVRGILMGHVGEEWTPALQKQIQEQLFGAADAAVDNPLTDIAGTITGIAGTLLNPMTYVHTVAFLLGLYIAFKGFKWVMESGGNTIAIPTPTTPQVG